MIKRELYLKKIRNLYDSDLIKVITGVRRCGKSVLLMQIIEELKERKVKSNHIIYLNFEDYSNISLMDPKVWHEYIKDQIKDKNMYYLLFDEVQNVPDYERVLNSFRATLNVSIFITGSNSSLLSGELATHLSGRYIKIQMYPFTFSELLELKKENGLEIDKEEVFKEYLEWGGMPQIYKMPTEEEKKLYISDLYSTIVLKDIVERMQIKDVQLLNRIIQFMLENIGGIISANSISNYMKKEKVSSTVNTILNYIEYINNSYIFNKANRYDIRGKNVMSTLEKYYVCDIGFLKLKNSSYEKETGGKLENIIYNELLSRGFKVYIGKTTNGEIDFMVENFDKRAYIQVCETISSEEVFNREFNAYYSVPDAYPKYVFSLDKLDHSKDGIIHYNIIDFLSHEKDIFN